MRYWKNESGQMLVMLAVCLSTLLAFMGLAVDVGLLFHARRQVQTAADAAASAAALDYQYNGLLSSAQSAGLAAASANGLKDTSLGGTATVDISKQPASNYGAAGTNFLQAIVSEPNPTFFMKLLSFGSINVAAKAVAAIAVTKGCVWALGTTGKDIDSTGSGDLSVPSCEIYDDSSSSNALNETGSGSITAAKIGVVGNYKNTGSGSISPTPMTGMVAVSDPLASLQPPAIPSGSCSPSGGAACNPSNSGNGNQTVNPGTYTSISNSGTGTMTLNPGNYIINGNLTNNGSGSLILGAGNYTITGNFSSTGSGTLNLGSGLYIVKGNLQLAGSGPMSGTGISFYTEGQTSVTGSGNVNISAPTSGAQDGILIFQSRSDSQAMSITGSANLGLNGIVYVPDAQLNFTGSGSGKMYTDLVVKSLNITGSGSFSNYAALNTSSPLTTVVMVE
jgi:Flp pilus assembly protein TadG